MATERNEALRRAVEYLVENSADKGGNLTLLGQHFKVSRQRVQELAVEYRRRKLGKLPVVKGIGSIRERVTA